MTNKRNRALDNLGDPAYAELAFQAIERAFNPLWLGVEGNHPMFGENKVVKLILDFMRLSDALYSPN